ncbi:MAG: ribbon-helix-helix domain-containing protein [Methanotrichaceae archaeon]
MAVKRVTVQITDSDLARIQKLVEDGNFINISDCIRTAIRFLDQSMTGEYIGRRDRLAEENEENKEV